MYGYELVENMAHRKSSGGVLPVYFHFADDATEKKFARELGMTQPELRAWMNNDIEEIYLYEDVHIICSDPEEYAITKNLGFACEREGETNTTYDLWGCGWSIIAVGQELRHSPIRSIEEVYTHTYPDPHRPDIFYGVDKKLEGIRERGHASFIGMYYALFERAWGMVGFQEFLEACYTNEEAVEFLLDKILDYKIELAKEIVKFHPTIGHTGDDYGIQLSGIMTVDMFRKYFKPRYQKLWKIYKDAGIPVMHHSCGNCMQYLDDMIDAGLDILHPVQQTALNIEELSARYGKDLSFFGSIDTINTMTNGTPEDVRRNIHHTVDVLGKNNGLLLAFVNVMPNTPAENVRAAIETIRTYRDR